MSNALVRRLCNALEPTQRKGEPARLIEAPPVYRSPLPARSPQIWTPPRAGGKSFAPGSVARTHGPDVIELPRFCAIWDEAWIARYEWGNGRYEYTTSAELPKHQLRRYGQENVITLPPDFDTQNECCAICHTWSPDWAGGGAVCDKKGCGALICYGRVSQSRFFRCRDSCKSTGQLVTGPDEKHALVPGRRGGNLGTQL